MSEPFQNDKHEQIMLIQRWKERFPSIIAGITTRRGGVSEAPYTSFNCGLHVGDAEGSVIQNRKKLTQLIDMPFESLTCANQVHGSRLYHVQKEERGRGRSSCADALDGVDALYTTDEDTLLVAYYADCVPLLFLDPVKRVIGVAHAGWKGTRLAIGQKLIAEWRQKFWSQADDLFVAVGPAIGACCYEVSEELAQEFTQEVPFAADHVFHRSGRYFLDLKEINRAQLIKAGISPNRIEVSSWCTSCNQEYFYSHRKESGRTGRMAAFIAMRRGMKS